MRIIGRVKWFNKERGYGFIESNVHPHILVRCPDMESSCRIHDLRESEKVTFEMRDSFKGPYAARVERYEDREGGRWQ